jgi:hypothetical protein
MRRRGHKRPTMHCDPNRLRTSETTEHTPKESGAKPRTVALRKGRSLGRDAERHAEHRGSSDGLPGLLMFRKKGVVRLS